LIKLRAAKKETSEEAGRSKMMNKKPEKKCQEKTW
jgi:hypothetical protein